MLFKRGTGVSHGVITGPAFVLGTEAFRIPQRFVSIDAVESEVSRFHTALDQVCDEISESERLAEEQLGSQYSAIFSAHLMMVRDPKVIAEIESLIREKCFSPEHATHRVLQLYAKRFQKLGNKYFAERAADVFDLEKRLVRKLIGEPHEELSHLTQPVVLLAHNLTPSETANLNRDRVLGFATEVGGRTSHTAILAGALGIPAVVGCGSFLREVQGGETVVINGTAGEVIIEPDEATLERSRESQARIRVFIDRIQRLAEQPARTKDGVDIRLLGNIEFPEEVGPAKQRGAAGIGLYRTEFLYLETDREPAEEDHYAAYRQVIDAFPGETVVIRTLDLGADKIPASFRQLANGSGDTNLGLRSIRVSLQHLPLFKTQLRAILRAAHGTTADVRIMFPLVSTLLEFRQAKMILADVIEDLEDTETPFRRDIPVGMMVEVPSAAVMAEEFAREVGFFSIGTNDLIQYTLACDRGDAAVANLYRAGDPSIIRLIETVVKAANRPDGKSIPVTVCGQMGAEPLFIPLLLGMGIRQLSISPHAIPEARAVISQITMPEAEAIFRRARQQELARDVEGILRGELLKICPDLTP